MFGYPSYLSNGGGGGADGVNDASGGGGGDDEDLLSAIKDDSFISALAAAASESNGDGCSVSSSSAYVSLSAVVGGNHCSNNGAAGGGQTTFAQPQAPPLLLGQTHHQQQLHHQQQQHLYGGLHGGLYVAGGGGARPSSDLVASSSIPGIAMGRKRKESDALSEDGGPARKHAARMSSAITPGGGGEGMEPSGDAGGDAAATAAAGVKRSHQSVRQNHSEIEKRRRDKMNTYINELSTMIPTCVAMSRKMDKLTVLRLAVQHLKSLRTSLNSYTEGMHKPAMLSDQDLKRLVLQSADGFLFVVDSTRGRILYVSETVSQVLNYCQSDLFGQSLFDILHPKDIGKVKEQISSADLTTRERLIDSKTMLPLRGAAGSAAAASQVPQNLDRFNPGARRSFFCRMKAKPFKEEAATPSRSASPLPGASPFANGTGRKGKKSSAGDRRYVVVQCTGYLKSWALTKIGVSGAENDVGGGGNGGGQSANDAEAAGPSTSSMAAAEANTCMSCLVAVGRAVPSTAASERDSAAAGRTTVQGAEFSARLNIDGNFAHVDQRMTALLGYLPHELVNTSLYEHVNRADLPRVAEWHRAALMGDGKRVRTQPFRVRTKEGRFVALKAEWRHFRNPWTKEVEYIISKYQLCCNVDASESKPELSSSSAAVASLAAELALQVGDSSNSNSMAGSTSPFDSGCETGGGGANNNLLHQFSNSMPNGLARDLQRVIANHASEAALIGRRIAEEMQSSPSSHNGSPKSTSPLATLVQQTQQQQPDGQMDAGFNRAMQQQQQQRQQLQQQQQQQQQKLQDMRQQQHEQIDRHHHHNHHHHHHHHSRQSGHHHYGKTVGGVRRGSTNSNNGPSMNESGGGGGGGSGTRLSGGPSSEGGASSAGAASSGGEETNMAVMMSLLEADAGLGGPPDLNGLPWPLP